MYQSNRSINIQIFVQMPPSLGQKAVQMPPPLGKFPDYCFNFSVASVMLPRLCKLKRFIRQHMFIYYRYKSFLNTFKYRTQLVQAFGFQPIHNEYAIFSIKVCLRHDLSTHAQSARLITGNQGWRSNSPPPPPLSGNQIHSLPGRKRHQMFKLPLDWYITCTQNFLF